MTYCRRRIVAVKWLKLTKITLLCNPFESKNCVSSLSLLEECHFFFPWIVSVVISDARRERPAKRLIFFFKKKAIKPYWAKKKKITVHLWWIFLSPWFKRTGLISLTTQTRKAQCGGTTPCPRGAAVGRAFLEQPQRHWGTGVFSH